MFHDYCVDLYISRRYLPNNVGTHLQLGILRQIRGK